MGVRRDRYCEKSFWGRCDARERVFEGPWLAALGGDATLGDGDRAVSPAYTSGEKRSVTFCRACMRHTIYGLNI